MMADQRSHPRSAGSEPSAFLRSRFRTPEEIRLMAGAPPFPTERLVTLANWQEPPFNRWAFQHVRDLIPTARIRRGDGPVWRLPRDERDLSSIRFRTGRREMTVERLLADTWTDGFLVLQRGHIVAERYFNGLTPDTTHLLMSVSKSVTSMIAGVLAAREVIDVSSGVADIVPELAGTSFEGASIQHLLDMRAGTKFDETYDDPEADVRVYEQVYLWRPRDGRPLPADALGYFATLRNDGEHGGPFRYRSILTDVLAWVLERASGIRLHELIAQELWQPMGAEFDAEITVDAHGNPMADGGICATLRDLARFGQLFLAGGRRGRRQIVPPWWIEDTIRGAPDGATAFVEGDNPIGYLKGAHYRNCWWVDDPATPFFHAAGINGQHVFVHPPSRTVVAKISTWPVAWSPSLRRATAQCVLAIADALTSEGSASV
jgi:CubicO group peptidase (beta-lactamase class C family)